MQTGGFSTDITPSLESILHIVVYFVKVTNIAEIENVNQLCNEEIFILMY